MFRTTKLISLFFIVVLGLALAGCRVAPAASGSASEHASNTTEIQAADVGEADNVPRSITIGYMGPLTGGAASIGQEILDFSRAVAQIYSEKWGIDIQIAEADTEINPDTGRIVAEQFIATEAIIGVIGPVGSQVCESTQPLFADAGMAHVTPSCTYTALTQPGTPTFFRPIPTDAEQSKTIAHYMLETLTIDSAYIIDDQSTYSVNLSDDVASILHGADVQVTRASVTQEDTDFSSVATAIAAADVDVVLFPSQIVSQMGTLAVQLREQGFEGDYFLGDGGFTPGWVDSAGAAAEGSYVTFFAPDPNLVPEAEEMNARYREITGNKDFGAFGGAGGIATQVLLEAIGTCIDAGEVDRACVVDAMTHTDLDNTVLGIPVTFGEGNQAAGGFSIFQVRNGEFTLTD